MSAFEPKRTHAALTMRQFRRNGTTRGRPSAPPFSFRRHLLKAMAHRWPRPRHRPSFANNPQWMTNPITKIILLLLALTLSTKALAQSPTQDDVVGTCGGILHVDKSRLWVGSAKAEIAEDLPCFIAQSEVKRVLSVCVVGRWCEVAGVGDFNCEPGKCEISKVTSVSRRKKR